MSARAGLRDFHDRWHLIRPPLSPPAEAVARIDALLGRHERVLLLGITPALAGLPRRILAVDWDEAMVRRAWPGDTPRRRAMVADWCALPLADGSLAAAVGDAPPTMLRWPEEGERFARELARVLLPRGRAVLRCFCPEPDVTRAWLRERVAEGAIASFHEFKLLHNMACVADAPGAGAECHVLWEAFQDDWQDRYALARAIGATPEVVAGIDHYRDRRSVLSYPPRAMLRGCFEAAGFRVAFERSGDYPLADLCPLLVLDR